MLLGAMSSKPKKNERTTFLERISLSWIVCVIVAASWLCYHGFEPKVASWSAPPIIAALAILTMYWKGNGKIKAAVLACMQSFVTASLLLSTPAVGIRAAYVWTSSARPETVVERVSGKSDGKAHYKRSRCLYSIAVGSPSTGLSSLCVPEDAWASVELGQSISIERRQSFWGEIVNLTSVRNAGS